MSGSVGNGKSSGKFTRCAVPTFRLLVAPTGANPALNPEEHTKLIPADCAAQNPKTIGSSRGRAHAIATRFLVLRPESLASLTPPRLVLHHHPHTHSAVQLQCTVHPVIIRQTPVSSPKRFSSLTLFPTSSSFRAHNLPRFTSTP